MKKANLYFRFHIGDYLADTNFLDAEEHGAYLMAMLHCYKHDFLPSDMKKLKKICKTQDEEIIETILEFFTQKEDKWIHRRIKAELKRAESISKKASESGKRGAEKRHEKQDVPSERQAKAKQSPSERQANAELTSNQEPVTSNPSNIDSNKLESCQKASFDCPAKSMVDYWNEKVTRHGLPTCKKITAGRRQKLKSRFVGECDGELDVWRKAVDLLCESPHHVGDNERGWKANIDFLLQPNRVTQMLEHDESDKKERKVVDLSDFKAKVIESAPDSIKEKWQIVLEGVLSNVGANTFASWFVDAELQGMTEDELHVQLPSKFHADWIQQNHIVQLQSCADLVFKNKRKVIVYA